MKRLLIQLDTAKHPSVFDRIVAFDGGADEVLSYGGVEEKDVRDLVHGAIFTRGPKDLHHTAIFIGGTDMAAGERLLAVVRKTVFGPMRVSVMLDSNGSNTTAVAAVARMAQAVGDLRGKRAVVLAGTGPVGMRAAGLLTKAGAVVTVTSRRPVDAAWLEALSTRFGGAARAAVLAQPSQAGAVLEGAEVVISAGPPGVCLANKAAWAGRPGLLALADLNAVPPLGIQGVEVTDSAAAREGATVYGALGVGSLKMKIHKACIARLFSRNDLVLDAETIADVAREIATPPPGAA
jgi:hypothetical protein